MSENPYAASHLESESPPRASDEASAQDVFWAWEKRRLTYNAILAAITIPLSGTGLAELSHWGFIVEGAIVANLAFCLGPVAEGYAVYLGANRQSIGTAIFVVGTLLAVMLTLGSLLVLGWPQ